MNEDRKEILIREILLMVFFLVPAAVLAFVIYVLVDMVEVYSFPDSWTRAGEILLYLILIGYPLQLAVRWALWGIRQVSQKESV